MAEIWDWFIAGTKKHQNAIYASIFLIFAFYVFIRFENAFITTYKLLDYPLIATIMLAGMGTTLFLQALIPKGEEFKVNQRDIAIRRATNTGQLILFVIFIISILNPGGVMFQISKDFSQNTVCFYKNYTIHAYPPEYFISYNTKYIYWNGSYNIIEPEKGSMDDIHLPNSSSILETQEGSLLTRWRT